MLYTSDLYQPNLSHVNTIYKNNEASHENVPPSNNGPSESMEGLSGPALTEKDLLQPFDLFSTDTFSSGTFPFDDGFPSPSLNQPTHQQGPKGSENSVISSMLPSSSSHRKPKAPTLRAHDWEPYKPRILELHIDQKLPLLEVKAKIEQEFGFKAEYVRALKPPLMNDERQIYSA
jgi:hypothetical protein